jgi:hypothetical protein
MTVDTVSARNRLRKYRKMTMKKIGRNEKCPCLSGKKYKHCCALKQQVMMKPMATENALKITLKNAVDRIGAAAIEKKQVFKELGVFLLFSTLAGDAWLLEITESDCVQLARDGRLVEVPIDESPETIVVDWTHTFAVKDKRLEIVSYEEKSTIILPDAPTAQIHSAIRRIRKRHSPELLGQVHLDTIEAPGRV